MPAFHNHHHRKLNGLTFPLRVAALSGSMETVTCVSKTSLGHGSFRARSEDGRTFVLKHPDLVYREVGTKNT